MAVFQEPFDISIEALISIKIVISVETETIIIFTRIFISALDPLTPAKCQKDKQNGKHSIRQPDWGDIKSNSIKSPLKMHDTLFGKTTTAVDGGKAAQNWV